METNTPCDVSIIANPLDQFNVSEDMSDQLNIDSNSSQNLKTGFSSTSTMSSVSGKRSSLSSSSSVKDGSIDSRSIVVRTPLKDISSAEAPDFNKTLEFAERVELASDELISSLKVAKSIANPTVDPEK
jgi:hypothetical protein